MHRRGFTIIEILISIIIAAIVMAGAVPLILNTISSNKAAKIKVSAYQAAQKEIETAKNTAFAGLSTHVFTASGVPGTNNGTLTVTKPNTDLASIDSKVTWTFQGRTQNVELQTYIQGATP